MVVKKDNLVVVLLCGIPCAGKSTWIKENLENLGIRFEDKPVVVLSKDTIRESIYGSQHFKMDFESEKIVKNKFNKQLAFAVTLKEAVIVIDNMNCTAKRLNSYYSMFGPMLKNGTMKIYVKFFDIPLLQAKMRNILRRMKTGKWIPNHNMNEAYASYKSIDKNQYETL